VEISFALGCTLQFLQANQCLTQIITVYVSLNGITALLIGHLEPNIRLRCDIEAIPPPSLCGLRTNNSSDSIGALTTLSFSKLHRPAKHFRNFLISDLLSRNMVQNDRKEILIKAVAQATPTYIMGVFCLPRSVCDDLTRLVRNFWWGSGK
jgi:hypothetical protein